MTLTLPVRVGIPLQAHEALELLSLARKVPMTTHSTVAKVAMLYGLQQLSADPQLVEKLIIAGLARRPGRGRRRKIAGPEETTNHPHGVSSKPNETDPGGITRPGHHAEKTVTE